MRGTTWMLAALPLAPAALLAGGIPAGRGVDAPSGVRFESAIGAAGDVDDFVISGIAGQEVRLGLRTARKSALTPVLQLIAPDGTIAVVGLGRRATLRHTLTITGPWIARVLGDDPQTTGAYRLNVRYGSGPAVTARVSDKDAGARFAQAFTAGPGARVDLSLRFRGGRPEVIAVTDPDGAAVPGLAGAVQNRRGRVDVKGLEIPWDAPFGEYEVVYGANDTDPAEKLRFSAQVRPRAARGRRRRVRISGDEPRITFTPFSVAAAGEFEIGLENGFDVHTGDKPPAVFLGDLEVQRSGASDGSVRARAFPLARLGEHLVHVRTATGQWATGTAPILVANLLQFTDQSTRIVPSAGGVEIALAGISLPAAGDVELLLDFASVAGLEVVEAREDLLRIVAPPHAPGVVAVNVRDTSTRLVTPLHTLNFRYVPTPQIDDVLPALVPVLGGETIELRGREFADSDSVFLETTTPGVFEEIVGTYVSDDLHRFAAPVRPSGRYRIVIESDRGFRDTVTHEIVYFDFADATAGFGLDDVVGDPLDAATLDVADYDGDGWDDLFLSRAASGAAAGASQTRVLRNDQGTLVDVTADVLSTLPPGEDWRARRVRVVDLTGDARPDLVLLTDSRDVPAAGRSRLRILENVASATAPGGRAFKDVTVDVMAPPREMQTFGDAGTHVADAWDGSDMWIGDLDGDGGHADLVVTGETPFADINALGAQYAVSALGGSVVYSFYWPATRVFTWDAAARNGEGAFRFDFDRLPRMQGVIVNLSLAPPGVRLIACNPVMRCDHTFTPFAGTSLAVQDLDGDGRNDIAVVSPDEVLRRSGADLRTVSSLQVAVNRPGVHDDIWTFPMTDLTEQLTPLGLFRGDTLAAGQPERGGQNAVLAVTDHAPGRDPALRIVRINPLIDVDPPEFEDLTDDVVPATGGGDAWQARGVSFRDVNSDGRDDLLLLTDTAPGGDGAAFRILRALPDTTSPGWRLRHEYTDLVDHLLTTSDHLEGAAFAIGDLDRDGLPEFVISRATATGAESGTRAVSVTAD